VLLIQTATSTYIVYSLVTPTYYRVRFETNAIPLSQATTRVDRVEQ